MPREVCGITCRDCGTFLTEKVADVVPSIHIIDPNFICRKCKKFYIRMIWPAGVPEDEGQVTWVQHDLRDLDGKPIDIK